MPILFLSASCLLSSLRSKIEYMSDELIKIPPQNLEAEASLLGSILIDKDAIIKIADVVTGNDYYKDANRLIFEVMLELFSRHEPIDILSVGNRLEELGQLEAIGGRSYLMALTNTVPTASNVAHYAQIVHKKATLRRLLSASAEIAKLGYNEEEDIVVVLVNAEQRLYGVS